MIGRILLIWLGLFTLAFINGAIREVAIKRFIKEPWAHHWSAFTALMLFTIYIYFLWPLAMVETIRDAWMTSVVWFVLTVFAEAIILNRWVSKMSWQQIAQTYNVARGEMWPLVLVWVGLLPLVMYYFR